jgi:hypothetical protein
MTHIEQLHLDAMGWVTTKQAAINSAEITKNIACEFAIFFSGVMPKNCKEIMRRLDLPHEEKVKLVFKEYLKTKENDTPNN